MKRYAAWCLSSVSLTGCATSPSLNLLGAYFPDWLFCISGAIVLCFVAHRVLTAAGWAARVPGHLLALGYVALATLLSLSAWLIFFQN